MTGYKNLESWMKKTDTVLTVLHGYDEKKDGSNTKNKYFFAVIDNLEGEKRTIIEARRSRTLRGSLVSLNIQLAEVTPHA